MQAGSPLPSYVSTVTCGRWEGVWHWKIDTPPGALPGSVEHPLHAVSKPEDTHDDWQRLRCLGRPGTKKQRRARKREKIVIIPDTFPVSPGTLPNADV